MSFSTSMCSSCFVSRTFNLKKKKKLYIYKASECMCVVYKALLISIISILVALDKIFEENIVANIRKQKVEIEKKKVISWSI